MGVILSSSVICGKAQEPVPLHDNMRTMPYPRTEHELYLNPPPLIVPKAYQTGDSLQFSLSQNPDFATGNTMTSKPVLWSMYSPHQVLNPGTWYWRYRSVGNSGNKPWSETLSFNVKDETPKFTTPPLLKVIAGIPASYPRLYCFLEAGLAEGRAKASTFPEYKDMINRASGGLSLDYSSISDLASRVSSIYTNIGYLNTAYKCTGDTRYSDKMLEMVRHLLSINIPDNVLNNDFETGHFYLSLMLQTYDACYNQLTQGERGQIESGVISLAEKFFRQHYGFDELHVYNNHFWQRTIYSMFQVGLMFYDKYPIARQILEYYYELWATRGPVGGFDRDGQHFYSAYYFNLDMYGLYYMSAILTYLTGTNFREHPWYQNSGEALLYSWPPLSKSGGFGDGNEIYNMPYRTRIAFADYIARETNSSYAQWYVNECNRLQSGSYNIRSDFEYRMYRFANMNKSYSNAILPTNRPKLKWFKDSGEVMMHSDISNTLNDLFLSMRSSPYGSGSHTLADQNSFNLHYKGVPIYRSTGYYLNFSDIHNLLSYRHTRAHNSILIDGIGQPFTTRGSGNVVRAMDGKNISYCLGDASNAYKCISEYKLWQDAFYAAGITQTPEFGFGVTPLNKYRRHLFLLHPDKVLIYDELEANTPVRWDWLLHSPVQFNIQETNKRIVLEQNMMPLSSLESGTIQGSRGTLSFDYIQSGADNVNLEVYVNGQLLNTLKTKNEQGVVKQSGNMTVNAFGDFTIRLKQANSRSGQVAIDNLKWTSSVLLKTTDTSAVIAYLSVKAESGTIIVTTSKSGQVTIFTVLGQPVATMNVLDGRHEVSVIPGVYIVNFVSNTGVKSAKIIVQ